MYCEGKYKLTSHSKSYRLIKGVNKTIITIIEGKWIGFLESYSCMKSNNSSHADFLHMLKILIYLQRY
jgi:hypothetical protein